MGFVMGGFSSSANFGNAMGTAVFSIVVIGCGASWPTVVFVTCCTMALAAGMFALFGQEHPPPEYASLIDEHRGMSIYDEPDEPDMIAEGLEKEK